MNPQTIIVVGAGVCGLCTALTAAQRGFRCVVLEKRKDRPPDSSASMTTETDYWGTRARNVYLDRPALRALRDLGLDVEKLPRLRMLHIDWGSGLPVTRLKLKNRKIDGGVAHLTAEEVILQRDWIAIPTLSQIEVGLRAVAEDHPLIELHFDSPVESVEQSGDTVVLSLNSGEQKAASLVVVADGGGPDSLSSRFGIQRETFASDSFSVVALAAEAGDQLLGCAMTEAVSISSLTPTGWAGVVSNGEVVVSTVNTRWQPYKARGALDHARAQGLVGRVLDEEREISAAIDRATKLVMGDRILLAGDAASRGSPTFGLGAQFGVLFSQFIDRCLLSNRLNRLDQQMTRYQQLADDAIERRIQFERDCLAALDQLLSGAQSMPDMFSSELLLSRLNIEKLDFEASAEGGCVDFCVRCDFESPASAASVDLLPFRQFGVCGMRGRFPIRLMPKGFSAQLSERSPFFVETGSETMEFFQGELSWERVHGGWQLRVVDPAARRRPKAGTAEAPYVMEYGEVRWHFPDAFLEGVTETVSQNIKGLARRDRASTMRVEFIEDAELRWGPFNTLVEGEPVLEMSMWNCDADEVRISLELLSGRFHLLNRIEDLVATDIAPPWARTFFAMATPLTRLWDPWLSISSRFVRRIDFDLDVRTQSALISFNGFDAMPLRLSSASFQALRRALYGPEAIADLFAQGSQAIERLSIR